MSDPIENPEIRAIFASVLGRELTSLEASSTEAALDALEEKGIKVAENRLRRMAKRQGLHLMKSRRRDTRAIDYGGYMLVNAATNFVVAGGTPNAYNMSIYDVAAYLTDDK